MGKKKATNSRTEASKVCRFGGGSELDGQGANSVEHQTPDVDDWPIVPNDVLNPLQGVRPAAPVGVSVYGALHEDNQGHCTKSAALDERARDEVSAPPSFSGTRNRCVPNTLQIRQDSPFLVHHSCLYGWRKEETSTVGTREAAMRTYVPFDNALSLGIRVDWAGGRAEAEKMVVVKRKEALFCQPPVAEIPEKRCYIRGQRKVGAGDGQGLSDQERNRATVAQNTIVDECSWWSTSRRNWISERGEKEKQQVFLDTEEIIAGRRRGLGPDGSEVFPRGEGILKRRGQVGRSVFVNVFVNPVVVVNATGHKLRSQKGRNKLWKARRVEARKAFRNADSRRTLQRSKTVSWTCY
ncbi:hypothetical protein B0H16DRAFT_1473323 [Mycena metata]|uniref:Uncharacterized protein n=1 Tax=Mycena metata TaxID=1033252 RepID=A0AAD7MLD1_9AGAR|nr:hypothetical protein B0H16DRAFT_1473323 [Mycena metata]